MSSEGFKLNKAISRIKKAPENIKAHIEEKMWPPEELEAARAVVENVRLPLMQEIFGQYATKSGVDPQKIHLVPIEETKVLSSLSRLTSYGGFYTASDKSLTIAPYSHEIASDSTEEGQGRELSFESYIRSCYFHEQTHSGSFQSKHGLFFNILGDPVDIHAREQIGYSKNRTTIFGQKMTCELFNEGVTDKIAEEVYSEYMRRLGQSSGDANSPDAYIKAYPGGRILVDAFIDALSASSDVPQEVVWKGIVRGYFEGQDLSETPMQELLSEFISPYLLSSLLEAQHDNEVLKEESEELAGFKMTMRDKVSYAKWRITADFFSLLAQGSEKRLFKK